jgi:hypothetical protein
VTDLEDELKQLKYPDLNAAFRAVLETVPATDGGTAKQNKNTVAAARLFLTSLATQTGVRATKQDAALAALPAALEFLAALAALKPSVKAAATLLSSLAGHLAAPAGSRLLLAWLLLKDRKIELDTFGLDYSLKQACGLETAFEGRHAVQLLQALLEWEGTGSTTVGNAAVERSFATPACCTFMQLHESGGTEWFNKERFEELLEWLSIIALMAGAPSKPASRTISALLGRLAAENRRLNELAAHAGYRTKLMLLLLEPAAARSVVIEPATVTKKTTGEKDDVKSSARTIPPKAPHNKAPR